MLRYLVRRPWIQAAGAHVLGLYLRFALGTTRWQLIGEPHLAPMLHGTAAVVAFWHERLPLMPGLWMLARRKGEARRVHVVVSRHRDGRLIGNVVRGFGIVVMHGSSSRGGATVIRRMLSALAQGEHVAITPDGPRGPRRRAAPGVAHLAELSSRPVLPCAAQTSRRIVLRTWDQMVIPLPFARGVIVCGPPIHVREGTWQDALPEIEAALNAAARMADEACCR